MTENEISTTTLGESSSTEHDSHCFVVMPYGRDRDERRWFKGWYEMVIAPAVTSCGYTPVLAAAEEQPGAINDEIRTHLALDPMVVVDLGGMDSDESPNPNVMYELGIRHAFGLPVVMMGWESQTLPFDVGNQRAVLTHRDLLSIEPTKKRLMSFLQAGAEGRYYNPMEAVGRAAALDIAAFNLGEDSTLALLADEVRELRKLVTHERVKGTNIPTRPLKIRELLPKTRLRRLRGELKPKGIGQQEWIQLLEHMPSADILMHSYNWSDSNWVEYLSSRVGRGNRTWLGAQLHLKEVSEEILEKVRTALPDQPWPTGIHKDIAAQLKISNSAVSAAISKLIRSGEFLPQIEGQVYVPASSDPTKIDDRSDRE